MTPLPAGSGSGSGAAVGCASMRVKVGGGVSANGDTPATTPCSDAECGRVTSTVGSDDSSS